MAAKWTLTFLTTSKQCRQFLGAGKEEGRTMSPLRWKEETTLVKKKKFFVSKPPCLCAKQVTAYYKTELLTQTTLTHLISTRKAKVRSSLPELIIETFHWISEEQMTPG